MNGDGRTSEPSAAPRPAPDPDSPTPKPPEFRWQALFQKARDAVFVLNRRRRILFVNRAWEGLTGLSATEARGLACVRRGPMPQDPWDVVVRSLCCPPPEVLKGQAARNRRHVAGAGAPSRWWDVEFLPLYDDKGLQCIIGKITVLAHAEPPAAPPLPERLVALRETRGQRYNLAQLASELPAFKRILDQVRLAGQIPVPVVIVGETGAGKQWLARTIHELTARHGAFIALDCARLPARAIAAVLLGESRAQHARRQVTHYLQQPQHLPRDLQLRLCHLRAADSGQDAVRTIVGISSEPAEEIKAGRLLEEFYCALGTVVIALPPLRERAADLPALVERFLKRAHENGARPVNGLSEEAWELVCAYRWPGNLRELYTALQFAAQQTSHERIDAAHLPAALRLTVRMAETPGAGEEKKLSLDRFLEEAERRLIRLALRRAKGNRSRAAELLEVWRPRLLRRMEALGITDW